MSVLPDICRMFADFPKMTIKIWVSWTWAVVKLGKNALKLDRETVAALTCLKRTIKVPRQLEFWKWPISCVKTQIGRLRGIVCKNTIPILRTPPSLPLCRCFALARTTVCTMLASNFSSRKLYSVASTSSTLSIRATIYGQDIGLGQCHLCWIIVMSLLMTLYWIIRISVTTIYSTAWWCLTYVTKITTVSV